MVKSAEEHTSWLEILPTFKTKFWEIQPPAPEQKIMAKNRSTNLRKFTVAIFMHCQQ
jgi:hypothetical protein